MQYDLDAIDPTLPDVSIRIAGKERKLAFDYQAICVAEKLTGQNLMNGLFEADFTTMGGLLFAALLRHDKSLTLDEVGTWINFKTAPIIYRAITDAWLGSMPAAQDGEAGEAPAVEQQSPAA